MNKFPTRGKNCIDLVLSSDQNLEFDVSVNEPFCNSDHNSVLFKISFVKHKDKNIPFRNFRKADYEAINGYLLSVNWDHIFSYYFNANDLYNCFLNICKEAINLFVPLTSHKKVYSRAINKLISQKKSFMLSPQLLKTLLLAANSSVDRKLRCLKQSRDLLYH